MGEYMWQKLTEEEKAIEEWQKLTEEEKTLEELRISQPWVSHSHSPRLITHVGKRGQ
jgi:hypothetical protein